jgi:phage/plasmid-associated DNA primase
MCSIDGIKGLVGEDRQSTDVKYGEEIEFINRSKLVFAMNTLPGFAQNEPIEPILRRILIMPFDKKIEVLDGSVEERMLAELPGIFNKAIIGLQRVTENNKFTNCERGIKLVKSYEPANKNYLEEFFDTYLVVGPKRTVFSIEIYQAFQVYINHRVPGGMNNKMFAMDTKSLGRALRRHEPFRNINLRVEKKRFPGNSELDSTVTTKYYGIGLKTESDIRSEYDNDVKDDEDIPF